MGLKILFLVLNRIAPNSMNVCSRNVNSMVRHIRNHTDHEVDYLSMVVGADGYSQKKFVEIRAKQFDRIVAVYGSFYFHKDAMIELLRAQSPAMRLGWFTTDYEITPAGICPYANKDGFDFVIGGFDNVACSVKATAYKTYHMINLNTLVVKNPACNVPKPHNIIYYGRYREGREDYFKRYFVPSLVVSTSKRNVKLFEGLGCVPSYYDKISWQPGAETLKLFRHSLYIEDTFSHAVYCHLANRFYEALFCNTLPIFCRTCKATVDRSGYKVPERMWVSGPDEFAELDGRISPEERKAWLEGAQALAEVERRESLEKIVKAIENG